MRLALGALALALAFVAGTLAEPLARPPALAAATAQLLPPGTRVEEVAIAGGGVLRAQRIEPLPGGVRLVGQARTRVVRDLVLAGQVRGRVLWMGSDQQGRDVAARLLVAARSSALLAAVATALALGLGTAVGLVSALLRPSLRRLVRMAVDAALALPRVLLLLLLAVALRGSWLGLAIAVGLGSWMEVARLVEADARALLARGFTAAAGAAGAGTARVARVHLVPNLGPVLRAAAPLLAVEAVLLEATLSYLGVGAGDVPSWGRMIAEGQRLLVTAWWPAVFPGVALSVLPALVVALGGPSSSAPARSS